MRKKSSKNVILTILVHQDATLNELELITGYSADGIRGRISELRQDGYNIVKKKRMISEYVLEYPKVEKKQFEPQVEPERSTPEPIASKKVVKEVVKEAKRRCAEKQKKQNGKHEWTFEEENELREDFFRMSKAKSKNKAEIYFAKKFGITQYFLHKKLVHMGMFLK